MIPYDEFSQLKEKTDFRGSDRTDLMRFHAAFSGHNRYRIEGIPSCSQYTQKRGFLSNIFVVMCIEKRSSYVKIATVQCKKKQEQFIDERGKL